jgi:hypothetical protein
MYVRVCTWVGRLKAAPVQRALVLAAALAAYDVAGADDDAAARAVVAGLPGATDDVGALDAALAWLRAAGARSTQGWAAEVAAAAAPTLLHAAGLRQAVAVCLLALAPAAVPADHVAAILDALARLPSPAAPDPSAALDQYARCRHLTVPSPIVGNPVPFSCMCGCLCVCVGAGLSLSLSCVYVCMRGCWVCVYAAVRRGGGWCSRWRTRGGRPQRHCMGEGQPRRGVGRLLCWCASCGTPRWQDWTGQGPPMPRPRSGVCRPSSRTPSSKAYSAPKRFVMPLPHGEKV